MDLSKQDLQDLLDAVETERDLLERTVRKTKHEDLQAIYMAQHDRQARLADRLEEAIADIDCDEAEEDR